MDHEDELDGSEEQSDSLEMSDKLVQMTAALRAQQSLLARLEVANFILYFPFPPQIIFVVC